MKGSALVSPLIVVLAACRSTASSPTCTVAPRNSWSRAGRSDQRRSSATAGQSVAISRPSATAAGDHEDIGAIGVLGLAYRSATTRQSLRAMSEGGPTPTWPRATHRRRQRVSWL